MTRYMVSAAAALAVAAAGIRAFAQPARAASSVQLGLYGGAIVTAPSGSFTTFPGVSACNEGAYTGSSGSGFTMAGVLGLSPSFAQGFMGHVGGSLKVGFASSGTSFAAEERLGAASDPSGDLQNVVTSYTIDATTSELRLEPVASYWLNNKVPLIFSIGARLGFQMGGSTESSERLVSPSGATFGDGSAERNRASGDLQGMNAMQAGIVLGLGYDLPVARAIVLRPEITGSFGITAPVDGVEWKSNEIRFGVSALYTLPRAESSPLQDE